MKIDFSVGIAIGSFIVTGMMIFLFKMEAGI